jgi:hypothetical protein
VRQRQLQQRCEAFGLGGCADDVGDECVDGDDNDDDEDDARGVRYQVGYR